MREGVFALKLREYTFNSLALMITGIINIDGYNATPYFTRLQHCGSSRDLFVYGEG